MCSVERLLWLARCFCLVLGVGLYFGTCSLPFPGVLNSLCKWSGSLSHLVVVVNQLCYSYNTWLHFTVITCFFVHGSRTCEFAHPICSSPIFPLLTPSVLMLKLLYPVSTPELAASSANRFIKSGPSSHRLNKSSVRVYANIMHSAHLFMPSMRPGIITSVCLCLSPPAPIGFSTNLKSLCCLYADHQHHISHFACEVRYVLGVWARYLIKPQLGFCFTLLETSADRSEFICIQTGTSASLPFEFVVFHYLHGL